MGFSGKKAKQFKAAYITQFTRLKPNSHTTNTK
nr:Rha family transcriptional regulator [Rodentibacter pneumotropicus]